jgi:dynactin complex subunit
MYLSNYSKNLITAEEKVAELMKQRDAALIRAEKAEAERVAASQAYDCTMAIHGTVMEERDRLATELTRLRAEVEQLTAQLRIEKSAAIHSLAWAEKAEAELRIAQNWVDHHSQHADDLIGKNVKLREALEQYRNCVIVGGINPAKVVLDDLE